ncbi:MAG: xanthine dehydrogenase family protein subunit M [Candidatus Binataceae bacterium]
MHEFSYEAPSTLAEAVRLLAAANGGARVLCGGTDLLIQMRAGVRQPSCLVDVKGIPELRQISFDHKTGLRLGAAVSCVEIFESAAMRRHYPGLTEAAHLIGSTQIQSRASVGGNLCNGSPAADSVPALIALGAVAHLVGPKGERDVPVEDFVTGPGQTVVQPGEILVDVRIAPPRPHSSDCYLRLIPRNEMDIAVVGVGAAVTLDADRCVAARIALGAVGPTQIVARKAGDSLIGKALNADAIESAAHLAIEASKPIDDMRGTAEYRRHVVGVLTRRALEGAAERARGN